MLLKNTNFAGVYVCISVDHKNSNVSWNAYISVNDEKFYYLIFKFFINYIPPMNFKY